MNKEDYISCDGCGEMEENDNAYVLMHWAEVQGKGWLCDECCKQIEKDDNIIIKRVG